MVAARIYTVAGVAEDGLRSTRAVRGLLETIGIELDSAGIWERGRLTLDEARALMARVKEAGGKSDLYDSREGIGVA